jgi:serine/threonine protein kinase
MKVHGNLKLSNVFLDLEDNVLAIGDFYIKHLTNKVNGDHDLYKSMINHLPPEFFTFNHDRDEYSDVWALGIILYQLSTGGELPFNVETDDGEFDEYETKRGILNVQYNKLEDREITQELLDKIFTLKPHSRITVPEIIKRLHGKIDMKGIKTAMKRASENLYDSGEESGDDIKKKLDFIINANESADEIIQRNTVNTGLDAKRASNHKGDNLHVDDSRDEEDYKHLDNLVSGHAGGSKGGAKNFMDNLPDSIASSSQIDDSNAEESKDDSSVQSAGHFAKARNRTVKLIKVNPDQSIKTNMMSLVKIVVLNKDKLLLFSDSQNYFMSLKSESLQMNDIFSPLSPTEAVLYFPPCPGVFDNNMLVVYKEGKLVLVDLLQSAERQKLHMVSEKVKFYHLESQSMMDSMTERSEAGDKKFLVPLSGCEFAVVFEQAIKIFIIENFSLKMVKEYNELIPDTISNLCNLHSVKDKKLTHLAVGTESNSQVVLVNVKTGERDKTLDVDEDTITNVFEIGKKYLAATSFNGHLVVWDKNTYIQLINEQIMDSLFIVLPISNSELFAVGGEGPLMIYNGLDKIAEVKIENIVDIAYNESIKTLICGSQDGEIYTYNIEKLL